MKIVIVGGVAGGASAAARARRLSEDVSIVVFERGSDVSFANCGLPYHIGGNIPLRQSLILKTPEDFKSRFNIDVRTCHEVTSVDPVNKTVTVNNLISGEIHTEVWDRLLLSTGAAPVVPPLPGLQQEGVFTLRNLTDMDAILAWIEQHNVAHTTLVGGGFIGLEVMEALSERGIRVTLLEMGEQVMAPVDPEMASVLHQEIRNHGVDLRLRTALTEVLRTETGFRVALSDGGFVQTDMVILAIGVKPENSLATLAGLEVGKRGGISVNACMQTSIPDIYAVGDAVETPDLVFQEPANIPLAGPANRQGRIAADNMLDHHSLYHGSQGTSICKVFSLSIGSVGANEKQLKAHGTRYEKVYVHAADHAGYYPGATMISLKLLFSPDTGKILGAQASGKKGVDKRIDVLAVAQRAGLTVNDLEHLELTYAPPFNSARDVVNQAGMVAANVIKGDTVICHVRDVLQRVPGSYCLLDIRSPAELKQFGEYPDALSIPLDSLRENLEKVPKDKEIFIGCQSGLRGHVAYRILQAHGFRTYNLSGGFITWQAVTESISK
ncbi:CoA-disulfide reductase [Salmonella enterica subsp. enterica serovar Ohio]|jgi:NADPH-dependent 2,4-dienoyl-CoA reductase/sulfur reductase-like enzyme/rhodanese-related sulfurtransferase|uniref:FAD-dependent oxidoreductase n=6 Tax=Enterobacteriaceae TaxID=543 RepID=A0AAE5DUX6_CITFR|nr:MULTISPECIES: FAD-dependent oxidoreductase [Enterobacteriaceae]EAU3187976.1 CoA-disulfide reductase [Salmonella enterica]EDF4369896.1 CoA-disulfide reductase [Salmonella enterica subsp. enterica serovar Senftenberg]EDU9509760.1 CoA-disulfide reductase [Salmonella enterica subsp. enterica serovar Ohio]EHK0948517.1 FAD-dependent oxidoreductase [Citrobacter farmeri]EIW8473681.1 CoA-disulfide reductase [Klebsiella pneumoniae]MBC5091451.1 FAD-dependent oxidoreductase [Klebsiella quasipneumoniae